MAALSTDKAEEDFSIEGAMGYRVRKSKKSFRIQLEWYEGAVLKARKLTPDELRTLGLADVPIEQLKPRLDFLNRQARKTNVIAKKEKIRQRLDDEKHAIGPEWLVQEFEKNLLELPDQRRVWVVWRAAKRLLTRLQINPDNWTSAHLYTYFELHGVGTDYAKKIIRILNRWGEFWARKHSKFYVPLKGLSGKAHVRVRRAHALKSPPKDSEGLTLQQLANLKDVLKIEQWNWLYVTFWFGLRPIEIHNEKYLTNENGELVANIYQSKTDTWKYVPLKYPEQKTAWELWVKGSLQAPLPKTLKRYTGRRLHRYCGRKGFAVEMWERGHDIVEVTGWLGKVDIKSTLQDYQAWKKVKSRVA